MNYCLSKAIKGNSIDLEWDSMEWHVEFLLAQAKQKLHLASTSLVQPSRGQPWKNKKDNKWRGSESGLLIRGIDPKLD